MLPSSVLTSCRSSLAGSLLIWSCKPLQLVHGISIHLALTLIYGSQIEDCTQQWTFQPNSFDYIHMRWLVGSIADWKSLFKEAYKCLKPGGYIESYEPSSRVESDDGTVLPGSALSQWEKFFVEGGRKIGRPFTIFEEKIQREGMREAGFVNIEERDFKVGRFPMLKLVLINVVTESCWRMAEGSKAAKCWAVHAGCFRTRRTRNCSSHGNCAGMDRGRSHCLHLAF